MSELDFETFDNDGRTRKITKIPYQHTMEKERAETVSAREFVNVKYRDVSAKRVSGGLNLKNGMVEYARRYAGADLAKQIEEMDNNRLEWMYRNKILDTEEFFVYDDTNVNSQKMTIRGSTAKRETIQMYIDLYNQLEERGRAEINASRRARRNR